jgi:hypothetical protein
MLPDFSMCGVKLPLPCHHPCEIEGWKWCCPTSIYVSKVSLLSTVFPGECRDIRVPLIPIWESGLFVKTHWIPANPDILLPNPKGTLSRDLRGLLLSQENKSLEGSKFASGPIGSILTSTDIPNGADSSHAIGTWSDKIAPGTHSRILNKALTCTTNFKSSITCKSPENPALTYFSCRLGMSATQVPW